MEKFEVIDHLGCHDVVFTKLQFWFDETDKLLWENQGELEISDSFFFPQKSNRIDAKILKWDTWFLWVRCRHWSDGIILSDDMKRIRLQANDDQPGNDPAKWSFFFNYFPFSEVEDFLRSMINQSYIRNDSEKDNLRLRLLEMMKKPRLFKKHLNSIVENGELPPNLLAQICNKLFDSQEERRYFLGMLINSWGNSNDPMIQEIHKHVSGTHANYSIIKWAENRNSSEHRQRAPVPSLETLREYKLSFRAKKVDFKFDIPEFKKSPEFFEFLSQHCKGLHIYTRNDAWMASLMEFPHYNPDTLWNASYDHFKVNKKP